MSCVAVAMPHNARRGVARGTGRQSCAGSTPRYKARWRAGGLEGWRAGGRQAGCPVTRGSMFARLSGESRIRREWATQKALGSEERALASRLGKDGTRLIRAGQLRERGSMCAACKGCSCFNAATLPRWRCSFSSAAASSEHPPPCTLPAYTCPFTTTWRIRRIATSCGAGRQG